MFSNGSEEWKDVKAAFRLLDGLKWADPRRVAAVGYSFGASVLLGSVRKLNGPKAFVFIAPPLSAVRDSAIAKDPRPKLFIAGQNDGVSSSVELQRILDETGGPVEFHEAPNADHGLAGHELAVAQRVVAFLKSKLNDGAPDIPSEGSRQGGGFWPWRS